MRKFLISALMVSSVVAVAPAAAQYGGGYGDRDRAELNRGGYGDRDRGEWNRGPSRQAVNELLRDLDRAENGIQRSVQRRIISQREAIGLQREANQLRNQLTRAGRNGLSGREFARLRAEVNRLEQRLRAERRDRDDRRY
jgi:polyhydroxyalkanoate synthesis regulator phasin